MNIDSMLNDLREHRDSELAKYKNKESLADYKSPDESFESWVNALGGASRVAGVIGVDESTIYRQMQKGIPDPPYLTIMRISLKNAELQRRIK